MYWCVGPDGSAVCPGRAMEPHDNGKHRAGQTYLTCSTNKQGVFSRRIYNARYLMHHVIFFHYKIYRGILIFFFIYLFF